MADRNIENLEEISKGYFNLPIKNNPDALEVWTLLYDRKYYNLKDKAYSLFFDGLNQLSINEQCIPKVSELSCIIHKKTGWTLSPTHIEYTGADDWFRHLEMKNLVITEVIRSKENIDYTPYPEAFHDIFGHLALMCFPEYAQIVHRFGLIYNKLQTKKEKKEFANFWWYVIEFGLMMEDNKMKAFGAGLLSSFGECNNAFSRNIILRPFDVNEMKSTTVSAHEFHQKLFIIDSFDQINEALDDWG